MSFTLTAVEVGGNKTNTRGKKYVLERKELNHIVIGAKEEERLGVFSAKGKGKYEFISQKKNHEEVDWIINVKDKTWELEHKQKIIGTATINSHDADNYEFKLNPNLTKPVKYGAGTLKITFNEDDTSFKIDREGPSGDRVIFAVYRCDEKSGTVGQGSGKVEIAQKEKRNFVLVITSLFCFVRMSGSKPNKRASMPEARIKPPTTSTPKRARSNSVDEKNKPATAKKDVALKKDADTPSKKTSSQSPKKSTGKKGKGESSDTDSSTHSSDESTDSSEERRRNRRKKASAKKGEKKESKAKEAKEEKTEEKDEKKEKESEDKKEDTSAEKPAEKNEKKKKVQGTRKRDESKKDDKKEVKKKDDKSKKNTKNLPKSSKKDGDKKGGKGRRKRASSETSTHSSGHSSAESSLDEEYSDDNKKGKRSKAGDRKGKTPARPKTSPEKASKKGETPKEKTSEVVKTEGEIRAEAAKTEVLAEALTQNIVPPASGTDTIPVVVTNATVVSPTGANSAAATASATRSTILKRLQDMEQGKDDASGTATTDTTSALAPSYTATVVALGGNQFIVTVNGGPKDLQSRITIDVRVDGVALDGSPFSFPQQ